VKTLFCLFALLGASGCMARAARIPAKAAVDLQCPEPQIKVIEVDNQGDTGPHRVIGCGKQVVYELNNLGEWVVNEPILKEPTHIKITHDQ
jgi:hypothetical protein